jgi:hypothetical protein
LILRNLVQHRNSQLFSVSKSRNARNLLRDLAEPSRDGFAALQTVTQDVQGCKQRKIHSRRAPVCGLQGLC